MKKLVPVILASVGLAFGANAATFKLLTPLASFGSGGTIDAGGAPYVTTGNSQYGYAFDPVYTNVLLIDRQLNTANNDPYSTGAVWVLDGLTANLVNRLHETNDDGTLVVTNGNFFKCALAVADDGAVYMCNLVNADWSSSTPFKIYRWPNSMCQTSPVVAFNSNDPQSRWFTNSAGLGAYLSLGLNISARGSGPSTQIICGSRTFQSAIGSNVVVFTTTDGTNFSPVRLTLDTPNNSFGKAGGIAFGSGNTFWGKNGDTLLYHMNFNLTTSNATTAQSFSMPGGTNWGGLAVDAANNLLGAVVFETGPDEFRLYDISDLTRSPVLLDDYTNFWSNAETTISFLSLAGGTNLYIHDVNNGLTTFSIDAASAAAPTIIGQPTPATKTLLAGQSLSYNVLAKNATGYQWKSNNVSILNATNPVYTVSQVAAKDQGTYTVDVSNGSGTVTSDPVVLTIIDATSLYHLDPVWAVGASNYLFASNNGGGTPQERNIAYNSFSNELYIVHRSGTAGAFWRIYGVDGTTATGGPPAVTKTLNTNGISGGNIPIGGIGVAADAAIYACTVDSQGNFKLYRWADSGSNTAPTVVFSGDPQKPGGGVAGSHFRFGDRMSVRGSGINTQILIDNQDTGTARDAVVFVPTDGSMTTFSNVIDILTVTFGNTIIGRGLQWESLTDLGNNNFWQMHKGQPILNETFDFSANGIGSSNNAYAGLPSQTCNGATDPSRNLLFTVRTNAQASANSSLEMYEVSDPASPVLIASYLFPASPNGGNVNCISDITVSGNYVFALAANNGLLAYKIVSGPALPPNFAVQPQDLRLIQGGSGSMTVTPDSGVSGYQWLKITPSSTNFTGPNSATLSFANAQFSDAASYRCIVSNLYGFGTSLAAVVTVVDPATTYQFSAAWSALPGNTAAPYVSTGGSGAPPERSMAYNALSNQLIIVSCGASAVNFNLNVVNPDTGALLYTMNTNGVVHTASEVSGSNPMDLGYVAVADDGAVYVCNIVPNASGGTNAPDASKLFRVYRWSDSGPTTAPVCVWAGDPGPPVTGNFRWGDSLSARGQGLGTELILDQGTGLYGAILAPNDGTFNTFTNAWFSQPYGAGSIGRSFQFGVTNTFWEKRKGLQLSWIKYDLPTQTATTLNSYNNVWPSTLSGLNMDIRQNLAAGIDYVGSATAPDKLRVYEVSNLVTPMLLASFNFPSNLVANANFIGQVAFGGNKIFALDGNNGLLVVNVNGLTLNVAIVSGQAVIYWPGNFTSGSFSLYSTTSLAPPVTWSFEGVGTLSGGNYWVTNNLSETTKFYRLQ